MRQAEQAELRKEFYSLPEDALVDRATVAAVLYLTRDSLEVMAMRGNGPPYRRIGRKALYMKREVRHWASTTGRWVENTAQLASAA